jgi:periplasmic divalent cation tolerance protein
VYVTAGSRKEAEKIAKTLVSEKLVACINYFPVKSAYIWNKKTESAGEYLLLCKTLKSRFPKVKRRIRELHSYELPTIVAITIDDGDPKYLSWVKEAVK